MSTDLVKRLQCIQATMANEEEDAVLAAIARIEALEGEVAALREDRDSHQRQCIAAIARAEAAEVEVERLTFTADTRLATLAHVEQQFLAARVEASEWCRLLDEMTGYKEECLERADKAESWLGSLAFVLLGRSPALAGVFDFSQTFDDIVRREKVLVEQIEAAEARAERLEGEVASLTRDYADLASRTQDAETRAERLRGVLNYLKVQAENGTLHSQVVIQNARKALEDDKQ